MKRCKMLLLLLPLLFTCTGMEKNEKIRVAASIAPLADLAHKVGGEYVDVDTIVPAGSDAHTFELTAQLMVKIAESDLLVLNGLGLEFWQDKVTDNAPDAAICIASSGITEIMGHDDDHHQAHAHDEHQGHGHEHPMGNPHVWLDPLWAGQMAKEIMLDLIEIDPDHAEQYTSNFNALQDSLHNLHDEIQHEISTWHHKRFVCFHPAWEYFADRFGLVQAGVIEKRPGNEPTPKDIVEIIQKINEIHAKAIFTEIQFPSKTSEMIAAESNIIAIPLDPIGSDNINDYFSLLRYNVAQMAKGLKSE